MKKEITTTQDYLAEKLQEVENSLKFRDLEANYWRKKYFDLMISQGKTIEDISEEIKKAMTSGYLDLTPPLPI